MRSGLENGFIIKSSGQLEIKIDILGGGIVKIAREGLPIIGAVALGGAIISLFSKRIATLFIPLTLGAAAFFRDPERDGRDKPQDLILAPADGRITHIGTDDPGEWNMGPSPHISIFLSPLDVHLNRAPVSGTVTYQRYRPGAWWPAFVKKAHEVNERNSIGLENDYGRFLIWQVAGSLARKVVSRVKPGHKLERGQRIGLIRLGSRTDIFMPSRTEILVKPGDMIKAGLTPIARIRTL